VVTVIGFWELRLVVHFDGHLMIFSCIVATVICFLLDLVASCALY
jgi:hypothetical protein